MRFRLRPIQFLIVITTLCFHAQGQQLPVQWLNSFTARGKCPDRISCIEALNNGDVVVAGYAGKERGAPDAFVMKRNALGDTLWTWYYDGGVKGEDYVRGLFVDAGGNVYVTGESDGTTSGIPDCFTAKISPAGTQQWLRRYPSVTNQESYGNAITVDNGGNVYVAGRVDPLTASSDWLVIKYNSTGVQQWADVLNGPGNGGDEALAICIAPNGNPTACGYAYSTGAGQGENIFVKQYTPSGTGVWTDTYSNTASTGYERALGLGYNSAGQLFVGGTTSNGTSNSDAIGLSYDAAGTRLWSTINVQQGDEYLLDVTIDNSGNIYFAGTDYLNGYVCCINANGSAGWRKKWTGSIPNGSDVFNGIVVDNNGGVYASGRSAYAGPDYYGNGGLNNQIIAKYNSAGDSLWTYRSADTINPSMGFAIATLNGKVYSGGFVTDTAYINENLYTQIIDTAGTAITEWKYNGIGDTYTHGQLVRTDAQNNVYCAATIEHFLYQYGFDVAIVKYNAAGVLQWERYYSTPGWNNDSITHMEIDPSGNLKLCILSDTGQTKNNYRVSIVTLDGNGQFTDTAWYLPSPAANTISKTMLIRPDGSTVIGANSSIRGGEIIYFDPVGNVQWTSRIDTTQFAVTRVNSLAEFPNGDIAVAGFTQPGGGNTAKGLVQRYTPAGTRVWTTDYDSLNVYDDALGVTVSQTGQVAVVGLSGYTTTGTSALITYDGATGQQIWRQVYNPNTSNEYGKKVGYTPAGNIAYLCRGWTGFVARYTTVQYSPSGVFQWATVYNQTASDREPVEMIIAPNNTVVTAGWWLDGTTTNANYVLVGYNSNGTQQFLNTWANTSATTSNPDYLRSMTRDAQGSYIVTGESATEFFNNFLYRMVTIKYNYSFVGLEDEGQLQLKDPVFAYPNPSTTGIFHLMDASAESAISEIFVYDSVGKLVLSTKPESEKIDLRHCNDGIYFIRYKRVNEGEGSLRVIKQ